MSRVNPNRNESGSTSRKEHAIPTPNRTGKIVSGQSPLKRLSFLSLSVWLGLLIVPTLAIVKLTHWVDYRIVFGCLAMVSLVTFVLYGLDKRAAEAGRRRTPEATLHGLELLGGWPMAFLAQRLFRHKISKIRYQVAFGLIVLLHEAVAFEVWQDFYYSRAAVHLMNQNGTGSKASELPEIHPADR